MKRKHIILLADSTNWAFDFIARSLRIRLKQHFRITVAYSYQCPTLDPDNFDLIYIFFWGDQWHKQFDIPAHKIIREVASYRWAEGEDAMPIAEFIRQYLHSCQLITTPCLALQKRLTDAGAQVFHTPNGIEKNIYRTSPNTGEMKVGWVGRSSDPLKGFHEIIQPVMEKRSELILASGSLKRIKVAKLYEKMDILLVSSRSESQPLPLMEAMASGCFPVCTNVGIVPEIIRHKTNGLIIERSVEAFTEALDWCENNLDYIREQGAKNSLYIKNRRNYDVCADRFKQVIEHALNPSDATKTRWCSPIPETTALFTDTTPKKSTPALTITAGRLVWFLKDEVAQASWLTVFIRSPSKKQFITQKLLAPSWWLRRLGFGK